MVHALNGPIKTPVLKGSSLDKDWSDEERTDYIQKAKKLQLHLDHSLNQAESPSVALKALIGVFGERIPEDTELITDSDPKDEVLSVAPATVSSPNIRTSRSA